MKTIYYTLSGGDHILEREMEDKDVEKHLDTIAMKQLRSVRWTETDVHEDYKTEKIEYVIPIEYIACVRVMDSNKEEKDNGDDR